jgi:hypothetical protein
MFHERVDVIPAAKLNISWTSVGVMADEGTSRYTEMYQRKTIHPNCLKVKI